MTRLVARLGGKPTKHPLLCDAWLADGRRFGDEQPGLDEGTVLGRWPAELETDAVARLAHATGEDASWDVLAKTPAVAQKLDERARLQPLDREILRLLRHLQQVCHRPRLHLRVEEERVAVSRARRIPVRAVADLVSHPGDWEHRTLRSIQPSRVLARQIEDEWNLYENRVAVRLVDHLMSYVARRLEELRKIEEALLTGRDHSDEARTSFWRARRVMTLWADTLTSKTEDELRVTLRRLEQVQRHLQALLDAPLYRNVPRRASVAVSLKPTNILVNDPHYRKVAALWRAWAKFGHKRQETQKQRAERRQREAAAWDRFVLHLVARGLADLGWIARWEGRKWTMGREGHAEVTAEVDRHGIISLRSVGGRLRLLPLCADLAGADGDAVAALVESWDGLDGEVVVVHVGGAADVHDVDRRAGWSFGGRAVLLACSPWGIDSEEKVSRLLNGWLNRAALQPYPVVQRIRALPDLPRGWDWIRYQGGHLVILRAPSQQEADTATTWASTHARKMEASARQAVAARRAPAVAPRQAVARFREIIPEAPSALSALGVCPVCGELGMVVPRPGREANGSDATWWAMCVGCSSEWGLRPCAACGHRYRALAPQVGLDLPAAAKAASDEDWPDKVLGRDEWAQPCRAGTSGQFRCPRCGECSGGGYARRSDDPGENG